MLAASLSVRDASASSHSHYPLVDPTLTFSTSPTTPSLSIPTPDDYEQEEVARLKAQVEALSRLLQECQKDPVSTPADKGASTAVRQTRKRPASQAYTEALEIERESADEREVRRVEKSTKKARTKGAREELDKMLRTRPELVIVGQSFFVGGWSSAILMYLFSF
ncbi:hypothetical protein V8E54_014619 [Elaphomyces granulatus]